MVTESYFEISSPYLEVSDVVYVDGPESLATVALSYVREFANKIRSLDSDGHDFLHVYELQNLKTLERLAASGTMLKEQYETALAHLATEKETILSLGVMAQEATLETANGQFKTLIEQGVFNVCEASNHAYEN